MFERFSGEARAVVLRAKDRATVLRHDRVGTEHLLLALLDADAGSTSRILRGSGLTEDGCYADIERLRSPLPGVLDQGDAEALQSIGIDLDAVLERIGASFGSMPAVHRSRRRGWLGRRSREWWCSTPSFAPRSKKVLELSLREAMRIKSKEIGAEHILLGLIREGKGLGAQILAERGIDLDELRRRTESALAAAA